MFGIQTTINHKNHTVTAKAYYNRQDITVTLSCWECWEAAKMNLCPHDIAAKRLYIDNNIDLNIWEMHKGDTKDGYYYVLV